MKSRNSDIGGAVFGNAIYIKAQERPSDFSLCDPAPFFRKEFMYDEDISEAWIYVQSPGFAKYYINGKDITEDIFISPISDYNKILWYNVYDVTALLRKGKNVIGVIAGNGFLNESFKSAWDYDTVPWRDAPQFLLCLRIDGKPAVVSDSSWRVTRDSSHIIYNHIRSGEHVDMRKYDPSWLDVEYDDSDWSYAIERKETTLGELRPVTCQPMRETERIEPVRLTKTLDGYLVDFGVTISGYMEITLNAPRGKEILFRYTEELDESGAPRYNGMDAENFYPESPFHLNKLIASGAVDTFKPMFSYHGFRYVVIEGLENEPISIFAHFTHNDVAHISDFECGNEVLNYIYNAGIRSTYSNMFWCLTDCPTREKLGWTLDAQASMEQTLINFDIVPLYKKWFEDIKVSMFEDGSLHGTIPAPDWEWGHRCGPVCDCLLYDLPYKIYLYTGDSKMLEDSLDYFVRYADFLEKKCDENYTFALGDWLGYTSSKIIPKEFVRDFYLIKALKITEFAYSLLGKDASAWEQRLEKRIRKFKNDYLDINGRCVINEQSAVAMILHMNIVENKDALSEQLLSVMKRDEYKITCGAVGIQYLYDALAECGRADLAYKIIAYSEPGYKTWFENGATTLWECHDGIRRGSHNHHMFSGVMAWFYKYLLGIAPMEKYPAFERIELKPCFIKEIGFVKAKMETPKGQICVEWSYENGAFVYAVYLPDGVSASFDGKHLCVGKNRFTIKENDNENN